MWHRKGCTSDKFIRVNKLVLVPGSRVNWKEYAKTISCKCCKGWGSGGLVAISSHVFSSSRRMREAEKDESIRQGGRLSDEGKRNQGK